MATKQSLIIALALMFQQLNKIDGTDVKQAIQDVGNIIFNKSRGVRFLNNGVIFLFNGELLELIFPESSTKCKTVKIGYCTCGNVAKTKTIVFCKACESCNSPNVKNHGHYGVPILNEKNELLGVMNINLVEGHIQNDKEEAFLLVLSSIIANIIIRVRENERKAKEQAKTTEMLTRMKTIMVEMTTIDMALPMTNVLAEVLKSLKKFCPPIVTAAIFLVEKKAGKMTLVLRQGNMECDKEGIELGSHFDPKRVESLKIESLCVIPMVYEETLKGVLNVDLTDDIQYQKYEGFFQIVGSVLAALISTKIWRDRRAKFFEFEAARFEASPIPEFRAKPDGTLLSSNPAIVELIGKKKQSMIDGSATMRTFLGNDAWETYVDELNTSNQCVDHRIEQGEKHFSLTGTLVNNGHRIIAGTIVNVSESESLIAELRRQSGYDSLTKLANRSLFSTRLKEEAAINQRWETKSVLALLDLDLFKKVNDTKGHQAGDEVLKEVAQRLLGNTRKSDLVARLGGDEFAILFRAIVNKWRIIRRLKKIIEVIQKPIPTNQGPAKIGISIGAGILSPNANIEQTQDQIDREGLYEAKKQGRNRLVFID